MTKSTISKNNNDDSSHFDLQNFFPYLVRVFYADVTAVVSSTYQSEYDLSPAEWRSMSILGESNSLTSNEIVQRSSMDKVAVSRAVARMKKKGWLKTSSHVSDGRSKLLQLSPSGIAIYLEIVPKVLEIEKALLAGISDKQQQQFLQTMMQIRENAAGLSSSAD